MTRALGLDLGSKRIGVALSTSDGVLATPYEVVQRIGDRAQEHRKIAALAAEAEAEVIVVGVPYHLDGRLSPNAHAALAEAAELHDTIGLPVETYDERLTTVTAQRSLNEMNLSPAARRRAIDQVAAAVMLQAWLDHRRALPDGEPEQADEDP
ncbi:MAG TPA: Holliday junction resolvase RuvX [Microthrixaceae bacterium]|jgi:putative Holliday junction resolvase|nr:Holliday junction resolvase RuvX [Microthrixaceae bacterium]